MKGSWMVTFLLEKKYKNETAKVVVSPSFSVALATMKVTQVHA